MKRIIKLCLLLVSAAGIITSEPKTSETETSAEALTSVFVTESTETISEITDEALQAPQVRDIDIDLTQMSNIMAFSQVNIITMTPEDFPESDDEITVTGTFDYFWENEYIINCRLIVRKLRADVSYRHGAVSYMFDKSEFGRLIYIIL